MIRIDVPNEFALSLFRLLAEFELQLEERLSSSELLDEDEARVITQAYVMLQRMRQQALGQARAAGVRQEALRAPRRR
jgi:hypothetical protein